MKPTPYDEEIQLLLEKSLGAETTIEGLPALLVRLSPRLSVPPHLCPLIDALERAVDEPVRLTVSMPPQHGKTTTILHGFVRHLLADPSRTHAYATYADRLTKAKARTIRRLARDAQVQMVKGATALDHWETVEGGGMIATSVAGSLTGKKVDGIMVIDDPFKDRADAESKIQREKVWEFFTDVVQTRLHESSSCIVVQTRWHTDDLIGRIQNDETGEFSDWEHINLQAIGEEGDALWPEVHPIATLEKKRGILGDYSFEALYQGRPRPRGASVFKEPARFILPKTDEEWAEFIHGKHLILAADPAATEKTSADYSVLMLLAKDRLGPEGTAWVLDVKRVQCTVPTFVDIIHNKWNKWRCKVAVEAVGGFKAVPQMLSQINPALRIGTTLLEIRPTRDKFLRAQPVAAAWNNGRVMVPLNAPWLDVFLDEVLCFSGVGDRHDDQVDALAHGWNSLANMQVRRRGVRLACGPMG